MKKIDEIYKYLNRNSSREKNQLLKNIAKKFELSDEDADKYYNSWKKEYMKPSNISTRKEDAKKIAKEVARQIEKELEKEDHIAEVGQMIEESKEEVKEEKKMVKENGLEIIEKKVVKTVKAKGNNGTYEGETGVGVALENEGYKIAFRSVDELEAFCNEFKKVFGEI
ncbi:hypothetical protein ACQPVP_15825 [Clostridium nigeriense]|uniref:hypothetical protein n=1 Tax=Clostridium nigeriense TaxID=1805470 RepID=UPI003D34086B